jgi:hypothetical protein
VFLPTQQIVKTLSADVTVGDSTAPLTVSVSTNSASFSDSKTVSGTKEVGDKAKGPVTLNNFDDKEKVFAKGTVIQSAGLSFVLDSDVKVASASVSADGSTPGKGKGTVTASVIGTESNLAKGQRFRIDDLSSTVYYAINDEAFSGGTKKTVHIVSKKDADDLKSSVLQKAKNGSSSQGNAEEHAGSHLLETLTQTDISEPIFSKQIGDQADTVSIQSKVVTSSYYVSDSQVKSYIQESLKGAIQNGFVLRDDQITYTLKNVTKKKDAVHMDIDTMARAGKDIDKNALIASITMKGKAQVERLLKTTYAAQSYNVKFTHEIPFIPEYFPLFKKNIQLQISYQ